MRLQNAFFGKIKFKKMKNLFTAIVFYLSGINLIAQYLPSPSYLTVNSIAPQDQDNSVGAISNARNYAESIQYVITTTGQCYRKLKIFDGNNILLATSATYSHDHGGITKILFHPTDQNVVYALFQERKSDNPNVEPPITAPRYTYLRRFVYSGGSISMSTKYLVFENNNPCDFVIAPNGDLLVGSVQTNGSVLIKPVRYLGVWLSAPTLMTSSSGMAQRSPSSLWPLSMDMKGNTVLIAHNRGYYYSSPYIQMKKATYNSVSQTLVSPSVHYLTGESLSTAGHSSGGLVQAVGLKTTGEIMYITAAPIASPTNPWKLKTVNNAGIRSEIMSGSGTNLRVVVTKGNKTFMLRKETSAPYNFSIDLYSVYNGLEHTYSPDITLQPNTTHLTTNDCKALASGVLNSNNQYHQFFACDDCLGGISSADGEFVGEISNPLVSTFYGPLNVALYCSSDDVIFDGSASACEKGYSLTVWPINIATWATGVPLYDAWICADCAVPHNLAIEDYTGALVNNQYYLLKITVGSSGDEVFRLFKKEACGKSAESTAGLTNETHLNSITSTIYPNPNNGNFIIQVETNELTNYQLIDASGKIIAQGDFQNNTEINLVGSEPGIYFVKMQNSTGQEIKKIVIH
jgi:hypothetical protein